MTRKFLFWLAVNTARAGKFGDAKVLFDTVIKLDAEQAANATLGVVYCAIRLGQYEEAKLALESLPPLEGRAYAMKQRLERRLERTHEHT